MRLWRLPVATAHTTGCQFLCGGRGGRGGRGWTLWVSLGRVLRKLGATARPLEATGSKTADQCSLWFSLAQDPALDCPQELTLCLP